MTGGQYSGTFTATCKKPSAVVILKDTPDISKKSPTYVASLVQPTKFISIGLDDVGAKIGPLKTEWTITSANTRGDLPLGPMATNTLTPYAAGEATITAKWPASKKVTTTVSIFVTQLFFALGARDPGDYRDDLPSFVPGMASNGTDIDPAAMPQQLNVHVATPMDQSGTVRLQLADTTAYPGIAMNYPIPAPLPAQADMYFLQNGTPSQNTSLSFDTVAGDTRAVLFIDDYAAWAHLDASILVGSNTYTFDKLTLPVDNNGNKIADVGWWYSPSGHAPDTLSPNDDYDNDPAGSYWPTFGRSGDGLTVLEEYRGFKVGGAHQRLNPWKKDIFVVADPELIAPPINGPIAWSSVPDILHYITPDEADSNMTDTLRPVINPNRSGILGSYEQRGVRLRIQTDYPLLQTASGPAPVWVQAGGYTWIDGEDLQNITRTAEVDETPDNTQVAEYYPRAFENWNISFGQNQVLDSTVDQEGTPIVRCSAGQVLGCVNVDDTAGVVSRADGEDELLAMTTPDDYYTKYSFLDCSFTLTRLLTPVEIDYLRTAAIGHEFGHAIGLHHSDSLCGEIMFTQPTGTDSQGRTIYRTMLDVLPPIVGFDNSEIGRIRLHHNY